MTVAEKRQEILRSALELIAEQGFHGAPIAAIAGRAGVGAGTIYRYFENKDVLINAIFLDLHNRICGGILAGCRPGLGIEARFVHLCTILLRYFINNPLEFRYLEQYHNSPYGAAFRRDRLLGRAGEGDLFRGLLEEGIAAGSVKDLPLPVLCSLAFGPLLAVARDHILGFIELDESLLSRTVQACWDGIKMDTRSL